MVEGTVATRQEVLDFLSLFKGAAMLGHFRVRDRPKNRQGLVDLQATPAERLEVLLGLTPEDYVEGPKPDDTDPGKDVWVFGKTVRGTETYIKLRVAKDPRKQTVHRAFLWSFHPAEHPMRYRLRGGGGR
jgi:hypothetical protein